MRLLVIEDSELDYEMLVATLATQGVAVSPTRVETAVALREALSRTTWDLVISDHHLPGFSSGHALQIVKSHAAPPPFIIVSGVIGEETAVDAMRRGADDYLIKGRLARLGMAAHNAVSAANARRDKAQAQAQLAQSQEQLRNLSNRLQTVLDEERAAIARDIHDEIGGTLTAVKYDLDALRDHVAAPMDARLARALDALAHASSASQRILRNLRPPVLDAGLAPALEWLVRQARQRLGIDIVFQCNTQPHELDVPAAMAIYRTCQEALTNIGKHADAQRASVDLHFGGAIVSLEVSDDGLGFNSEALTKPGSLGLRGLGERARAAGGGLDISSTGSGTTLMLWLPRKEAKRTSGEAAAIAAAAVKPTGEAVA